MMKIIQKSALGLILFMGLFLFANNSFSAEGQSLFVSLTSNEIHRGAMAITFSTRVLQEQQIPATIFLNVEGVKLADKNLPGLQHVSGKTLQEMLSDFMASGGKVIVCPMCMKNVGGFTKKDIIDGAVVGGSDVTIPALFAKGTTVLSY